MEPEGSSPYSQEPATCPYPKPDPFSIAWVVPKDQSDSEASCDIS
jgi:hypothetical protein